MKTVHAESTTTFDKGIDTAPSPAPLTEEVIIPGYNEYAESFEVPGGDTIPLLFHGITESELQDRPALKAYIDTFSVSDEYGLVYNSVSDLIAASDDLSVKAEAGEISIDELRGKLETATTYTIQTVLNQMRYGRITPKQKKFGSDEKAALSAVQYMQRVVREEDLVRTNQLERTAETPDHITFVSKSDMKRDEKRLSRSFFDLVKNLMDPKNPALRDFFPRSGEIPTLVTQTLPTIAIDAVGIKKP